MNISKDLVNFYSNGCALTKLAPNVVDVDLDSIPNEFKIDFIRGVFDSCAVISSPPALVLNVRIELSNKILLTFIKDTLGIPCADTVELNYLEWFEVNAFDVLGKLYDQARIYKKENRDKYFKWCGHIEVIDHEDCNLFNWCKIDERAVAPSKSRVSDSGYDLTIIDVYKEIDEMTSLYSTGIKVQITQHGWYLDLVPRSSILKSGYILSNMTGVIDRGYTGQVLVGLTKINPNAPKLTLPNKIVQLIPRPIIHGTIREVDSLCETGRSDGGFGSTNANTNK